ncbi:MAG: DUF6377 domain-containing protein [Bacteroidales bacterium]|nr:DUF6377 domain-containing protein [Bacteroidales bacterium]
MKYKRIITALIMAALLPVMTSCSQEWALRAKFRELDRTIASKESYRQNFEGKMQELRHKYENAATDSLKWVYADSLFMNYSFYSISSASLFLPVLEKYSEGNAELEFRTDIDKLLNKCIKGDTSGFHKSIASLDTSLVKDSFRARYHKDILRILAYAPIRSQYYDLKYSIREEASNSDCEPEGVKLRFAALNIRHQGDTLKALDMLLEAYDKIDDLYNKARAAYNIGQIYMKMKDIRMAEYWTAEAAILDFKIPRREYTSLYQLSIQLFQNGQYRPAARYVNIAVNDAISSNHRMRFSSSAKLQQLVLDSLKESEARQRRLRYMAFAFLLIALAVFSMLLIRLRRQSIQLNKSYETISNINKELRDANNIKDSYVYRYMNLSLKYLGQVEEYRHELRMALKSGGTDAVLAMLRTPSKYELEYKEFYSIFDETFLGLYPDFIAQVNELLKPECRYDESGSLNTELRILAAIRLGITDNAQIASFFNCALSSVYTYRYRIRKNAICNKEDFENRIKSIT